jgi:hypothetical protein
MLHSLPITIDLEPGDEHESMRLFPLLKNVRIKGTRRPSNRPKCVYANNKHHTPLVMMYLGSRVVVARINERVDIKRTPGRLPVFDYRMYTKIRSSVERFFGWTKSFRRIQIRYNRLASTTYLGFLPLGCVMTLVRRVSR